MPSRGPSIVVKRISLHIGGERWLLILKGRPVWVVRHAIKKYAVVPDCHGTPVLFLSGEKVHATFSFPNSHFDGAGLDLTGNA